MIRIFHLFFLKQKTMFKLNYILKTCYDELSNIQRFNYEDYIPEPGQFNKK
jgi:hypothetical protein